MERLVAERGRLTEAQAVVVVQIAKSQQLLLGETDGYLVTREVAASATPDEKRALLDCCFAVAAAGAEISTTEDAELRMIANELGLTHDDFITARLAHRDAVPWLKVNRPSSSSRPTSQTIGSNLASAPAAPHVRARSCHHDRARRQWRMVSRAVLGATSVHDQEILAGEERPCGTEIEDEGQEDRYAQEPAPEEAGREEVPRQGEADGAPQGGDEVDRVAGTAAGLLRPHPLSRIAKRRGPRSLLRGPREHAM